MLVQCVRNVNDAWEKAHTLVSTQRTVFLERDSRNGPVLEWPTPVATYYSHPCERVLFETARNANPFFHAMEALWMLAGRDDVEWIAQFNQRMRDYSDDGDRFHGAYGCRWREYFDMIGGGEAGDPDQLIRIARMLRKDGNDRRAVLTMWDPVFDLERPGLKDLPCNTQVYFYIRDGKLTATVTCRSNDVVWGAYGANIVQFSTLLEYMAAQIGVPSGALWQVSNSWHIYVNIWKPLANNYTPNPYIIQYPSRYPLVEDLASWDDELHQWLAKTEFLVSSNVTYRNSYFPDVAQPLFDAWKQYKADNFRLAFDCLTRCKAQDWRVAATRWLTAVQSKRELEKAIK